MKRKELTPAGTRLEEFHKEFGEWCARRRAELGLSRKALRNAFRSADRYAAIERGSNKIEPSVFEFMNLAKVFQMNTEAVVKVYLKLSRHHGLEIHDPLWGPEPKKPPMPPGVDVKPGDLIWELISKGQVRSFRVKQPMRYLYPKEVLKVRINGKLMYEL